MKKLSELVGYDTERTCPDCGAKFKIRQNSSNMSFFLGCSAYPRCTTTAKVPEEYLMREAGQATFFDRPPKGWKKEQKEFLND